MDEQRSRIYLNVIAALLNCSSDREVMKILAANSQWIDEGFVQVMGQVADDMVSVGRNYTADWLLNLSQELASSLNNQATPQNLELYQTFLVEVLQTIQDNPNTQMAYLLLVANQDKLNENLAYVLQAWARATLPSLSEIAAQYTAATLVEFSNLIKGFALGNNEVNIEIAIIGYQIAATVFTRDRSPHAWATIQSNIALALCDKPGTACAKGDRIRGERADNLELVIHYYNQALQEYKHLDFPDDWARAQVNLGLAYWERIRGERADNIERAIECYRQACTEFTLVRSPQMWARAQNNLGLAYKERVCGNRADNLELAIECYNQALQVYTRSDEPEMWASVLNNLGNAYCDRLRGCL
ncbi:tetratricopeptide repeat protein [Scytonema sp. UIC 10036]|uniref:tetratricopeptide repeat protein n=1 Tax=Scytonema sp. UIC 10036 TaxID=2304196 RepID=UPI0012DAD504|nr:tetratricopeptide repeat protein [Scytonema sp. UIC 10036]MUG96475.1 tetratricopeptide repeat protein [Scytonema sp. UIC 10036]